MGDIVLFFVNAQQISKILILELHIELELIKHLYI